MNEIYGKLVANLLFLPGLGLVQPIDLVFIEEVQIVFLNDFVFKFEALKGLLGIRTDLFLIRLLALDLIHCF